MKVKCIDNQNVEDFLTKEKVYEVIEHDHRENYFTVVDDVSRVAEYAKFHFEVVPSIEDVIKDKEWEKRANAYQKIIDYKNQNEEKRTMNGLEAIELMKQGKMVCSNDYFPRFIDQTNGKMMVLGHDGEIVPSPNFDINYEGYREYIEPKPLIGWERNVGSDIYAISPGSEVEDVPDTGSNYDNRVYEVANYFSTKEKAEEISFKQTLFRKLQRFSDENGGNEIDWSNDDQIKYCIVYDSKKKRVITKIATGEQFGQVYFQSFKVSQEAIELFRDDLIKYFTHDWSGKNE